MVLKFHVLLSVMVIILVLPLSLHAGKKPTVVSLAPTQITNYEQFWRYWSNIVVKIEQNQAKAAAAKQFVAPINYMLGRRRVNPDLYMMDRARKTNLAKINQQEPMELSPITRDEMVATFKTFLAISGFASREFDSLKTYLKNTKMSKGGIQKYLDSPIERNIMTEDDNNIWRTLLKSLLDTELLSSHGNEIHIEGGSTEDRQRDTDSWGDPKEHVIKYYKMPRPAQGRLPLLLDFCADQNKIFPDLHRSLNNFQRLGSDPESMQRAKKTLLCMLEATGVVDPKTGKASRYIRLPIVLINLKMLHRFIKDFFPEYASVDTGAFVENIRTLVKACETVQGSDQFEVAYNYYQCIIKAENTRTLNNLKKALETSRNERAKIEAGEHRQRGRGARGK